MTLKDKCLITYPNKIVKRDKGDGLSYQFRLALHQQGFDDSPAIGIAQPFGRSPLGLGHHTEYIPLAVANARNITQGPIGIGGIGDGTGFIAVTVNNLVAGFQRVQCFFIGIIPAFAVGYRYFQGLFGAYALDIYIPANKLLVGIP